MKITTHTKQSDRIYDKLHISKDRKYNIFIIIKKLYCFFVTNITNYIYVKGFIGRLNRVWLKPYSIFHVDTNTLSRSLHPSISLSLAYMLTSFICITYLLYTMRNNIFEMCSIYSSTLVFILKLYIINWRDVQRKNVVNNVNMSSLRAPWKKWPVKTNTQKYKGLLSVKIITGPWQKGQG